jgi:hypothetical protein
MSLLLLFGGEAPEGTFVVSGGGVVAFTGEASRQGTFAVSGNGTVAFTGLAEEPPAEAGTFAVTGGGAVAFTGASQRFKSFVLSGAGDVWFSGDATGAVVPPSTRYLMVTTNRDGSGEVSIPCYDLEFGEVLSDTARCTFKVFADVAAEIENALRIGRRVVEIYRDENLVWSGPLWTRSPSVEAERQVISFEARGWFELFRQRLLRPDDEFTFEAMSPWNMAEEVIAYANTQYNTGITIGSRDGDLPTQRGAQYDGTSFSTLADVLTDIATLPDRPYDFWVNQLKEWNVARRRSATINALVIDETLIEEIQYEESFDTVTTEVYATGAGSGADTLYGHDIDSSLYPTYGLVTGVFNKNPGEKAQRHLDDGATNYLFIHSHPSLLVNSIKINQALIDWDDIVLGNWYGVSYSDRFVSITPTTPPHPDLVRPVGYFRVVERSVRVLESGREEVTLRMDQAIF